MRPKASSLPLSKRGRSCYAKFSPGFFDLIIFDEAGRSLFKARLTEVIEYFDAA